LPNRFHGIATFGSREWRRLFSAYVISSFGDEFTRIALFARVYSLGGQVEGLAGVAIAQFLPSIVFAPLAGILADRGDRKRWLVLTDLTRAPVLIGIAFVDSLGLIVALTAVQAALTAVFRPVEAALEPDLLEGSESSSHDQGRPDLITRANAMRVGVRQILGILGPALVGVLLEIAGARVALIVDAATYALSGAILFGLQVPNSTPARADQRANRGGRGGGFKLVLAHPGYRVIYLAQAVIMLLLGMQGPLFFDFSAIELGGSGAFAALMAALGLGSLAGSIALSRSSPGQGRLPVLFGVLAIDGAALLAFSYTHSLGPALVCMAVMGLISAVSRIIVRSYLQSAPVTTRGRVLGLYEAIQGPIAVLSLAAMVPLTERWSSAVILRGLSLGEIAVSCLALGIVLGWTTRFKVWYGDRDG
jgi:hypothetical protein